jgi:hypothetical protein
LQAFAASSAAENRGMAEARRSAREDWKAQRAQHRRDLQDAWTAWKEARVLARRHAVDF